MRIRELGIRMGAFPCGRYNAITDVEGVRVGHSTIIRDSGNAVEGVVRTGVTAVVPSADVVSNPLYAGYFSLNGNGELSGCHWIEESGLLSTPVALTNTHSLGVVRDAMIRYYYERGKADPSYWMLPVVGETWDGWLSDINGMHVRPEHLYEALDAAASGPVAEGCVGGGTGMILHEFKGGIGTSSRVLPEALGGYAVGVLVQGNYGRRGDLVIDGVPVGRAFPTSCIPGKEQGPRAACPKEDGSIIIVLATDAPLTADQCKRLARRAAIGLARTGSMGSDSSGDLFLAFSTANRLGDGRGAKPIPVSALPHGGLDDLFIAAIEATHEAIVNALCAATTMTGIFGRRMHALPLEEVRNLMKRYGKL